MTLKDYLQPYVCYQLVLYVEDKCVGMVCNDSLEVQKYGEYEVSKVWTSDNILFVQCKTSICKYYKTRTIIRKLTDYERGFYRGRNGVDKTSIEEEVAYCTGTRECDSCYCGGDSTKCTFYKNHTTEQSDLKRDCVFSDSKDVVVCNDL